MRILGVCGSLRTGSTNLLALRAAGELLPAGVTLRYDAALLARLPPFNPDLDLEGGAPPPEVASFRAQLRAADAVLLSSPEYAHGVPGALKNALDWLVSSGELVEKPTAVVVAGAGGGLHARDDLRRTLGVIGARLVAVTSLVLGRSQLTADGRLADHQAVEALRGTVAALVEAVAVTRREG
jgi:NAD(P)H-dependent FMN reductase